MFKVDLYLDRDFLTSYEFERAVSIAQVIEKSTVKPFDTITFKLNNDFVGSTKMIAEDSSLECVGFDSEEGFRIYQDTAIFLMSMAFNNRFDSSKQLIVKHSIGDGIYCEVTGNQVFSEHDMRKLTDEMKKLAAESLPIEKIELPLNEAMEIFNRQYREDVVKNLRFYHTGFVTVFKCGDYYDYYIRQLSDKTGIISEFELNYNAPGFCIRFPLAATKKVKKEFVYPQKLFSIHSEADKWLNILDSHYMGDINEKIEDISIAQDIQVEEALHEKKLAGFADHIFSHSDLKAVLIAGPSSSGKTTFTKRLSIQLQVNGIKPIIIGLDEYFHPRTKSPRKANGEFDFESINAIDLELFNRHLELLLSGREIELPKYDFISGKRLRSNNCLRMEESNILLIEGIHGLNDKLSEAVPADKKIKIYISCLNQLNIDRHNRIATTYFRKIRRIVRDNYFRGYTAEVTLDRWHSISEGEQLNIFPFQEDAELIFNSGLTYEINVLKKHALQALYRVPRQSSVYTEAQKLIFLVEHALDIPDDLVPTNSILREFIGGGVFKY